MRSDILSLCYIFILCSTFVHGCMRTDGGGGEVPAACGNCNLDSISLLAGEGGTLLPTLSAVTPNADGSCSVTATCDARGTPNTVTFMTFQDGIAPVDDPGLNIDVPLTCTDGAWVFTRDDIPLTVTEIHCDLFDTDNPCATCASTIPAEADVSTTLTASFGELVTDPDTGCVTMEVTCPASTNGMTLMQFNTNDSGPDNEDDGRVLATLTCNNNAQWEFIGTEGTIPVGTLTCVG